MVLHRPPELAGALGTTRSYGNHEIDRNFFRIWSGRWESNPRPKLGKLLYCHCTTPALLILILAKMAAREQPLHGEKVNSRSASFQMPTAICDCCEMALIAPSHKGGRRTACWARR